MATLVIDNGTIHLQDLLAASKEYDEPRVIRREELENEDWAAADFIILSGGHGKVQSGPHLQVRRLIRETAVPILGICWGFQLIATTFGFSIGRLAALRTGPVPQTILRPDPLFEGIETLAPTQDHRFAVTEVRPPLIALSTSDDGIEILKHERRPVYGIQAHPEVPDEFGSGRKLLENFFQLKSAVGTQPD